MIYLIDDNKNNLRYREYHMTFIEKGDFDGYLTSIEQLEWKKQASDLSHLEFLKDAKCILLHNTTEDFDEEQKKFLKGSTTNVTKIKERIAVEGNKIPLVLFSNKMGEAVYDSKENPNYISGIKKNIFYSRLWDFVEYYKNTKEIELRILAWGKNFRAKEVSDLAIILLEALAFRNGNETFKITDISGVLPVFKEFVETSFPDTSFPDTKYADIINNLEDNPITISAFCSKINLITESFDNYGKNIHPW